MKFTVGGRPLDLTQEQVVRAMAGRQPESIRTHLVEMHGTVFPPKQIFATVTGWERQTFTTLEAQRVLVKLGFVCRQVGSSPDGTPARPPSASATAALPEDPDERIAALAAAVMTAQAAIAGLHSRVAVLESRG